MDPLTYRAAGVDIEAGDEAVRLIARLAASTRRPEVLGGVGAFAAFVSIPAGYREPVLVSSTDGVGTKLKVAFLADRHDTVGIDLVAMGVNDLLVHGAEPFYFLDYLAVHRVEPSRVEAIVKGVAEGCRRAGCALVGGETAELRELYAEGEYDLAGFAVGVVERSGIITGAEVRPGDRVPGLASSGLHSNGYTLARKVIFERMGLDTLEVLKAAGTKWNFLPFRPGLVGGHCIGVDPYYLTHKAELMGYHPEVILAGRRINDSMGSHVARKAVQQMIHAGRNIKGSRVNVLGLTFKEDVPDIRNSKVIDIIRELHEFGVETFVHDPHASHEDALHEYGVRLADWDSLPSADALILAVPHRRYLELPQEAYLRKVVREGCIIDVKSVLDASSLRKEGMRVWRL